MSHEMSQEEKEAKFKEIFEKAKKGVLKYLDEKGGTLPMSELHDYSTNKYFIQHQRFSQMMEGYVAEKLVDYDDMTQNTTITQAGKAFIQ